MNSDYKKIEERMKSLPFELQKVLVSTQTTENIRFISQNFNLTIDKVEILEEIIGQTMLGFIKTKDLTGILSEKLEINASVSENITQEINDKIFREVRFSLQKLQEPSSITSSNPTSTTPPQPASTPITQPKAPAPTPQIPKIQFQPLPTIQTPYKNPITNTAQQNPIKPSLEQAGRFTIEKPPVGMPQYKEREINKENVLKGIEDPTISMVDHLLTTPVNTVSGIEVKKPVEKVVVEKKPYTTDPYREQI